MQALVSYQDFGDVEHRMPVSPGFAMQQILIIMLPLLHWSEPNILNSKGHSGTLLGLSIHK